MVKRGLHTMRSDTYQMLIMLPGLLTEQEKQEAKTLSVFVVNP